MRSIIFITGFSGSGKTTVGEEVAKSLGWKFIDTDDEIVKFDGRSIEAIFQDESESYFRRLEKQSLVEACSDENRVVSVGGGMVVDEKNLRFMESNGFIACLEARVKTIEKRLNKQRFGKGDSNVNVVRPMIETAGHVDRIKSLKSSRQFLYACANWTVHTDSLTVTEVSEEIIRAWFQYGSLDPTYVSREDGDLAAIVKTPLGTYPVWVGWGNIESIGDRILRSVSPGIAYLISDNGALKHARRVQSSLELSGIPSHLFLVPQGESTKSLDMANRLYSWLADLKAERGHLILAVGGGVVGDLSGYVAATFLRGMQFGQIPTTLLAMVDAAVGGKTAVDLPEGKNLVGAFYQPRFVLADVETLKSLKSSDLTSGWSEVLKHGLILDDALLRTLEANRKKVLLLDRDMATKVIRKCVRIKAEVVSKDVFETKGIRVLLNYGHTIGHAIESVTNYSKISHGEAVSVGMMAAAEISRILDLLSVEDVDRQRKVLLDFGLPVSLNDVDAESVIRATLADKKKKNGVVTWVLLNSIGNAVTRTNVSPKVIEQATSIVFS